MSSRSASAFVLAALTLVPAGTMAVGREEPDHAEHEHRTVRILEGRVYPETLRIRPSDAIGWLNYARLRATVSFDAEVLGRMICRSPGNFHRDGDRLRSGDIQAREFAALCSLKPGEYSYRVDLAPGIGAGPLNVEKTLTGHIVVEP